MQKDLNYKLENEHLESKEIDMLNHRKVLIIEHIMIGIDNLINSVMLLNDQADDIFERVRKVFKKEDSIFELYNIQKEKRVTFVDLISSLEQFINEEIRKIDYIESNINSIERGSRTTY